MKPTKGRSPPDGCSSWLRSIYPPRDARGRLEHGKTVLLVGKICRFPRLGSGVLCRAIAAAVVAGLATGCSSHSSQADLGPDNCNAPIYYVALGDSTVEGVGASKQTLNYVSRLHARLLARYPNSRLKNLGNGGATSGDVVRRQLDPAIRLQPGLVTLSVGPNDITTGVSVDVYEQHIDIIFSRLRHETAALVVVNLLPDLAVTSRFAGGAQVDLVGRQTAMFNEALARKAREHGVVLVDLYLPSREEVPRRPELLWKDGYHPSDVGYARWAELMWEDIDPRLADCGGKRMPALRSGAQQAILHSPPGVGDEEITTRSVSIS